MCKNHCKNPESGFSLLELLLVIILIGVVSPIAVLNLSANRLFAADNQALAIIDVFQEARQRALTERKTLRVEFNDTKKQLRLIDENDTTATGDDDKIIRAVAFNKAVSVGAPPSSVNPIDSVLPQSGYPVPVIKYAQTNYPLSANDTVGTLRFTKTGEVVGAGTNNLGAGAVSTGATIYVYNGAAGSKSSVVRAVTLRGITAASQLFKCKTNASGICTQWTK